MRCKVALSYAGLCMKRQQQVSANVKNAVDKEEKLITLTSIFYKDLKIFGR